MSWSCNSRIRSSAILFWSLSAVVSAYDARPAMMRAQAVARQATLTATSPSGCASTMASLASSSPTLPPDLQPYFATRDPDVNICSFSGDPALVSEFSSYNTQLASWWAGYWSTISSVKSRCPEFSIIKESPVATVCGQVVPAKLSPGLSTDAKAGIAVGGCVGFAILAGVLLYFVWRRWRRQRTQGLGSEKARAKMVGNPPGLAELEGRAVENQPLRSPQEMSATPRFRNTEPEVVPLAQPTAELPVAEYYGQSISHGPPQPAHLHSSQLTPEGMEPKSRRPDDDSQLLARHAELESRRQRLLELQRIEDEQLAIRQRLAGTQQLRPG